MGLPWQRRLANVYETQTKRFPIKFQKSQEISASNMKPFSSNAQRENGGVCVCGGGGGGGLQRHG